MTYDALLQHSTGLFRALFAWLVLGDCYSVEVRLQNAAEQTHTMYYRVSSSPRRSKRFPQSSHSTAAFKLTALLDYQ